jgi:hypothetical protein
MFIIGEAIVEGRIARARFACDVLQCRGACCTLPGGRGAPLDDDEVLEIQRVLPIVRKYIPEEHRRHIEQHGTHEGEPGNYVTACIDDRACVFVYYEHRIARCSLEKAFLNGETTWRKPISCHLFPIRIGRNGRVRYEQIAACEAGRSLGAATNTPLYDSLKDALVRKFGQEWYDQFRNECLRLDGDDSH